MISGIVVGVCIILAAASNAVMDTLAFKFKKSIFKNLNPGWWNSSRSWRNKYKNGLEKNGAKFPGSTTIFVFVTDAWHFFQFLCTAFLFIGLIFLAHQMTPLTWYEWILYFLIMKAIWGVVFQSLFGKIFRR